MPWSHLVRWFDPKVCFVLTWTCITAEYWKTAPQKEPTDFPQDTLASYLGRQLDTHSADDLRTAPQVPWVPQLLPECPSESRKIALLPHLERDWPCSVTDSSQESGPFNLLHMPWNSHPRGSWVAFGLSLWACAPRQSFLSIQSST